MPPSAVSITTPFSESAARALRAGDRVLLSGVLYTARDAAHKRLAALLAEGAPLPIDLRDQTVYYCGPAPAPPGRVIGAAGPTTSGRMDAYAPLLMEKAGLRGMIGKGNRAPGVIAAMRQFGCVYFAATGGAGALLSRRIAGSEVVCYGDLGPEAILRLQVEDFPLVVAIDANGRNLYEEAPGLWRR